MVSFNINITLIYIIKPTINIVINVIKSSNSSNNTQYSAIQVQPIQNHHSIVFYMFLSSDTIFLL